MICLDSQLRIECKNKKIGFLIEQTGDIGVDKLRYPFPYYRSKLPAGRIFLPFVKRTLQKTATREAKKVLKLRKSCDMIFPQFQEVLLQIRRICRIPNCFIFADVIET